MDFEEAMSLAKKGDLVYCDPPYVCSQAILYRGQDFSLQRLLRLLRNARVAESALR